MVERKRLLCISLSLFAVACGRGVVNPTSSSISIRVPSQISSQGVGPMAALPVGRTPCYGVSILGAGGDAGATCSPTMGIVKGYVQSGQSVTLAVPTGKTVSIQLFMYLLPSGQTQCPVMNQTVPSSQIENTFKVGEATGVQVQGADMSVTINATFPGLAQNIAQQFSLPTSCLASTSSDPSPFSISAGAQTLTGTGFEMTARAGKPLNKVLTGTGIKLIVR